jgi:peptidyl-prolyl cis-trans isomerase C
LGATLTVNAQDDATLIDEVIARVNSDIITLSTFRRAQEEIKRDLQQAGLQGNELEEAIKQALKGLLQQLIDSQLLVQRGGEIGVNVEAQINQFLIEWAKNQNIPPSRIDEELIKAGFDPDQVRQTLRIRFTREAVIGREVYSRVYQSIFGKEIEDYYKAHLPQFSEPESVHLAEIFISFEGKTREQVDTLVRDVTEKIRTGADFGELAQTHSNRPSSKYKGDLGVFALGPDRKLAEVQAKAIEGKKAGEVTNPIELTDGIQILRIVERKETVVKPLDEELKRQIQMRLAQERADPAVKTFIEGLRKEAYIWIAPAYQEKENAPETKAKDKP